MEGSFDRIRAMLRPGDWIYRDARLAAMQVPLVRDAVTRLLPSLLRLERRSLATIFVAHYPSSSFGSIYSEAALFVPVRHLGRPAVHCPWIVVDDDVALVLGRELLGFPKKLAQVEVRFDDSVLDSDVTRRGETLLRVRGSIHDPDPDASPLLGRSFRQVLGSPGLSLPRLVAFSIREEILEARRADLSLDVGRSPRDPLAELVAGPPVRSWVYRTNIGAPRFPLPLPVGIVSPGFLARTLQFRFQ